MRTLTVPSHAFDPVELIRKIDSNTLTYSEFIELQIGYHDPNHNHFYSALYGAYVNLKPSEVICVYFVDATRIRFTVLRVVADYEEPQQFMGVA